jgi:tetratricopeptide (TPR) repeat protein
MSKKPFGAFSIFAVLGLLFIVIIGLRTISTPEIWTHLAQGRSNAPISFLEADTVVNTTHLYDKITYAAWNIGGAPLLIILNILTLLATFILLLQVAKKWGGALSQGFALLIAGHLLFPALDVGPQTAMMLFIALFVFLLSSITTPLLLFCTLIPLQIVWTNVHGSFLYGPIIAALTAVQVNSSSKATARKKKQSNPAGIYSILALALAVSTLANPYLIDLHAQVLSSIKNPAPVYWSTPFLEYFQLPPLKSLILFVLVLGAGGLITLKKKLPILLTSLAVFGGFLAWTSSTNIQLFVVLSFPFIVLSLTAITEYVVNGSLKHVLGEQRKLLQPASGIVFILLIALSIIPMASNCAYQQTGSASNFGLGIQEELYPNDIETLVNHPAFPEKAINLAADGGYLAYKYNRKVFIDFRPGRYDTELLKNINLMMTGNKKAYDTIYESYRPEAFIINTLSPYSAQGVYTLLSSKLWKLAYFDGTTAILLLNKDEFAPLLNNTEMQAAGLAKLEKARADYAAKLDKGCRAGNPAELIGSGKIFLALNRLEESKSIFSLLLQGNSSIPAAWLGLGNSQLRLQEFDSALVSLKTATQMMPESIVAWNSYALACQYAGETAEFEQALKKANALAERAVAETETEADEKDVEQEPLDDSEEGLDISQPL